MPHLVLLGDSIFDNAAYVSGGPGVAAHLGRLLPEGWRTKPRTRSATRCGRGAGVRSRRSATTAGRRRGSEILARLGGAALVLALGACSSPAPAADDDPAVELVDTAIAVAAAGEEGWGYAHAAEADLDGDGVAERVVLAARVEMYRGRPAWDDGQPWQAYVEEADGTRTRLYARYVQLGTLTLRVALPEEEGGPATVVLLEHLPDRMTLYEASYAGPGEAVVRERFRRDLDPRGELASPRLP